MEKSSLRRQHDHIVRIYVERDFDRRRGGPRRTRFECLHNKTIRHPDPGFRGFPQVDGFRQAPGKTVEVRAGRCAQAQGFGADGQGNRRARRKRAAQVAGRPFTEGRDDGGKAVYHGTNLARNQIGAADKVSNELVGRPLIQVARRTDLFHAALAQDGAAVRHAQGFLLVMGNVDRGDAQPLDQAPDFNAHFDNEKNEIVQKKAHNIGIAVDTPEGLMVPVVKDVDRRSIIEIAQEIEHLAASAKERKLKLEDMRGGTFTITNIGSVGGMYSTPIINPPEVAIMGVHRIKEMPLVVDGRIKPRKVLGLSLCFDHRVVDGAAATLFMNIVMKHLEDPDRMLVDMI